MGQPQLIGDLLRARAATNRDRVALMVSGGSALTYGAWESRSNATARGLLALDVAAGDRVGLYFDNADWIDFALAYMATVKAGAVAVPLSSRFTKHEVATLLDRCGAVGVIGGSNGAGTLGGSGWRTTVADLADGNTTTEIQVPVAPTDIAEILYTSGTTGTPQGVVCRHEHAVRPLVHGAGWPPPWWPRGGVYLHANAISTAAGQLRLLEPLGPSRMTTAALPSFDPDRFCGLAAQHKAAVVQLVPAMATAIVDSDAAAEHDLSWVQVVSFGCAPLPPSLAPKVAKRFPRARLVNMYELTEARHVGTSFVFGPSARVHGHSVGKPRGATTVRVTDDKGTDVSPGVVGEVRLRWPGLPPQHYFRDARATAKAFVDGWTRTGDSGYLDKDGYLYLVDRLKDVVIKSGINIGTLEVESALREHPAVADCAVVGVPDPVHGEEVAAALVVRKPVSAYELRKFLRGTVPAHALPQRFQEFTTLPRNRSGKVIKKEVKARFQRAGDPVQPQPVTGNGTRSVTLPDAPGQRTETTTPLRVPEHLVPVLEQLIAGATDLAASRKLQVSPRTFSRRVAELLDIVKVETRFQCGAEIGQRGWVPVRENGDGR